MGLRSQAIERLSNRGETWNDALKLGDQITNRLESWCQKHGRDQIASRLLQTLINQRGYESCSGIIKTWMDRHSRSWSASHIVQKALRSGKGTNTEVVIWAKEWLNSPIGHSNPQEAAFLFRDLRDCILEYRSIDFSEISEILYDHINSDGPIKERRDLCRYWLELGGRSSDIKEIFQKLVQQDYTEPMVRFCFEAWTNTNTDEPTLFEREMKLWLERNASHPKASYVFGCWIKLGLELSEILDSLRIWLQTNYEDSQYSYYLSRYVEVAPQSIKAVGISKELAPEFLNKEHFFVQDCRNIEFILRAPFGSNDEDEIFEAAIAAASRYLKQHGDKDASAFLIAVIINRVGNKDWIRHYADEWLAIYPCRHRASLIYQALLSVDEEPESLIEEIRNWFAANKTYELAGNLLMAWVEAGCEPSMLRSEAKLWLNASDRQRPFPDADAVERWYNLW